MFSSVGCWEIPQARTAARAELGPLGVNSAVLSVGRPLPVYFDQRTLPHRSGWSVWCQKQTPL